MRYAHACQLSGATFEEILLEIYDLECIFAMLRFVCIVFALCGKFSALAAATNGLLLISYRTIESKQNGIIITRRPLTINQLIILLPLLIHTLAIHHSALGLDLNSYPISGPDIEQIGYKDTANMFVVCRFVVYAEQTDS